MIAFWIPTQVVAKQGCRTAGGIFYTPKKVKENAALLGAVIAQHAPEKPLEGPLHLRLVFQYAWRKAETKAWIAHGHRGKDTKPDWDNLCKQVCDVMEKCGFFTNDSQLAWVEVYKVWTGRVGVAIEIEEIEEDMDGPGHLLEMGDPKTILED